MPTMVSAFARYLAIVKIIILMDCQMSSQPRCGYDSFTKYSGTCLNRPAMGLGDYGRFIQVVFLGLFQVWNFGSCCMHCEEVGVRLIISAKNAIIGMYIPSK